MRNFTALLFIILFSISVSAQKPKGKAASSGKTTSAAAVADEKTELERAVAVADAANRIKALQKFVAAFPKSADKTRALELIASGRAAIADDKMRAGDAAGGVELFRLAVKDAPAPLSDKLFADVILHIPANLFFRGQQNAAAEIARAIEAKVQGNARQLLGLATFYLGVENAAEAKRLAETAASINPNLPAVYQTLGLANRLNFDLEAAMNSYAKALELAPESIVSKRSLAEMKRAVGKSDEAVTLYREILDKNPADALASNGLILALFDAGKRAEAESEMQKAIEASPQNLILLAGAAYSYASMGEAARAVDLAQKAIAVEPRYIWSYIALARGYLRQNKLYDAERALLQARAYGNFPTLNYELATVRAAGGFYREAAEELAKNFVVKDDAVYTKLGGRVEKQSDNFVELLAFERRASIFEPIAADDAQSARRLKSLLDFYQKSESPDAAITEQEVANAAEKFVNEESDGGMKLHRRLFAADRLLKKKKALTKAAELMKSAVAEVDGALAVPNPSSSVLADELYASRAAAIAANQLVIVPEVERQTLSKVLRGRIEEISGEIFLQENKSSEAVVRFRRAVGILPEKSAWWRSSQWHLGAALEADGKSAEALAAYIKSYTSEPVYNGSKREVIESLYQKVNGSLDGLDAKIGAKSGAVETAQKAETVQNQPANTDAAVSTKTVETPQTETKKIETKQTETSGVSSKNGKDANSVKSVFDPIIITVPKTQSAPEKSADETNNGSRASAANGEGKAARCELTFSQESVSLINNGGNLGILVGLNGDGDAKEIRASSNSAADVEVVFEPEIGASSKRAYFILKSVSRKTGVFTVTFEAPCGGKKEFVVKVR